MGQIDQVTVYPKIDTGGTQCTKQAQAHGLVCWNGAGILAGPRRWLMNQWDRH